VRGVNRNSSCFKKFGSKSQLGAFCTLILFSFCFLFSSLLVMFSPSFAAQIPDQLKDVGVVEKLGSPIQLKEFNFKDEQGNSVPLERYFQRGVPVLLTLIYYECPNLCNFMLNGLVQSLKDFSWTPGEEFEIVTISINPNETPELARAKKESYFKIYQRPKAAQGWHFLTGSEDQIKKLADQVGFRYRYEPTEKQYAHGAVVPVLTPEGKISRYLYGIEYAHQDLRLALLEASQGKIGTVVDRILLFCYRYDPLTRKYSVYLTKLMQIGCGATALVMGAYLFTFWRRQRKGA
jgi:protein SCO1